MGQFYKEISFKRPKLVFKKLKGVHGKPIAKY